MKLLLLLGIAFAQNTTVAAPSATSSSPATRTTSGAALPTQSPSGNATLDIETRARLCTQGSTTLVNAYKQCFPLFPSIAPSTIEADNGAWTFIRCLCATEWQAGSTAQVRSSVQYCPAIPGISKGEQAAVAADCSSGVTQQSRIVRSFGLRTFVTGKPYVPLSGLPPGVTSNTIQNMVIQSLAFALIFCVFM
jgi:hypothetical protein